MQSTACPTPSHTDAGAPILERSARPGWLAEVGQNLAMLSLSVTATAAVTVLGHLTLNLVG